MADPPNMISQPTLSCNFTITIQKSIMKNNAYVCIDGVRLCEQNWTEAERDEKSRERE